MKESAQWRFASLAGWFLVLAATAFAGQDEASSVWIRAKSGPVTVYLRGNDSARAEKVLHRILEEIHALQLFLPIAPARLTPIEIYVAGKPTGLHPLANSIWGAMVSDWGKFHSLGADQQEQLRKMLPMQEGEFAQRVIHVNRFGRDVVVATPLEDEIGFSADVASWYLACSERRIPAWISVGAQIEFATVAEVGDELLVGSMFPRGDGWVYSGIQGGGPQATSGGYNAAVYSSGLGVDERFPPMEAVLALTDPSSPGPEFKDTLQPFPITSAILLRYLTSEPKRNTGENLRRYIELQSTGQWTLSEICQKAFGKTPVELGRGLKGYVAGGGLKALLRSFPLPSLPAVKTEAVAGVEYERMLALVLSCAVPIPATQGMLSEADPTRSDWFLCAARAQVALAAGHGVEAVGEVERALAQRPNLAWLRVLAADSYGATIDDQTRTSAERSAAISRTLENLRQGLAADLRPRWRVQEYARLAAASSSAQPLDLKILAASMQLYPDDPDILSGAALVQAHLGNHLAGRKILLGLLARNDLNPDFRKGVETVARNEYLPAALEEIEAVAQTGRADEAMRRYDALLEDPQLAAMRDSIKSGRPSVLWTVRWAEMAALGERGDWKAVRENVRLLVETAPTAAQRERAIRVQAAVESRH
jgi:hypothetical protein